MPLLVVICLVFIRLNKPEADPAFTAYSDATIENLNGAANVPQNAATSVATGISASAASNATSAAAVGANRKPAVEYELFEFDPNTVDLAGLMRMGFSVRQVEVIINYRSAGAVFREPEDFARCYTVSEEKFAELRPYIRIPAAQNAVQNAVQGRTAAPGRRAASVGSDAADLSAERRDRQTDQQLTVPQADSASGSEVWQGVPREGQTRGQDPNPDQSRTPQGALIDLNSADSTALIAVRGIGSLTAGRIVRYREMLGGYANMSQLREIVGMTDQNYTMIIQQIFVDISKIQKIDINFASPESMKGHPYISSSILDKILKHRQLKGGWSNTEELTEQNILTETQAARLAPYLYFRGD